MTSISIDLPPELYERLRQVAEHREQSLEVMMVDGLRLLFGAPSPELSLLETLTDDILLQIIRLRLPESDAAQLDTLLDIGNQGTLADAQKTELDSLVAAVNRQMLLRSEALVILKNRGHDVEQMQLGA